MLRASVLLAGLACWTAKADEPKKPTTRSLSELSQEVAALQTLYLLDVTRPQLELLRKMASETAGKPTKAAEPKAGPKVRQMLVDLRAALVEAKNDDRIGDLIDKYYDLRQADKTEIDDSVDITDDAIRRVPEALRLLTPKQAAAYLGNFADNIADPLARILDAMDAVRRLPGDMELDYTDEVAAEVSQLLAGLDDEKGGHISRQVGQLLIVAHSLKDADYKTQKPDLEKRARRIVGDVGPTDVLRHVLEHALAELLSNPQVAVALESRLK
jgi:hypothetical protein